MIFSQIWERYFFKEIIKFFFLFLICFYGLYVMVDYASHTNRSHYPHTKANWQEIVRYYVFVFSSRAEILIPFALLISSIKTLCSLNSSYELVALMAGGFKLPTLMRPFLLSGLFLTATLFLNEQFLMPTSLKKLRYIEDRSKHQSSRNKLPLAARHLILEDHSLFLFQSYDTAKQRFFDVYWIQSIDRIYRIKYLYPYEKTISGTFVDSFVRESNGELNWQESFRQLDLPEMRFNKKLLQSTIIEPDILPLTELWNQIPQNNTELSEKETKLLTAFYWKFTIPWLCLLSAIAPISFCVVHSRTLPVFFIYVYGVFGFIAFYLLMDAFQILSKRQVVDPFWVIPIPFLLVFSLFSRRFFRI